MKKNGLGLICFIQLCTAIFMFAQENNRNNAEIVLLMDTSGTILQYYEDINKKVLTEVTGKFVRKDDTLHILSFNSEVKYEMSQKIKDEADLSRVVSRFLLLYQLGQHSDFLTGLKYCKQYISKLSAEKERILIIVSDGIFNPPDSSPYKNYNPEQIKNELGVLAGAIRSSGWKVYYVKLPFPADSIIRDLDGDEFYNPNGIEGTAKKTSGTNANMDSNVGSKGKSSDLHHSFSTSDNNTADKINQKKNDNYSDVNKDSTVENSDVSVFVDEETDPLNNQTDLTEKKVKEYTDVSQPFTEAAGAAVSNLSAETDEPFSINEDLKTLPLVKFPDNVEVHSQKLVLPLVITNTTDEDVNLKLTEIVLDTGLHISRLSVNGAVISLKPGEEVSVEVETQLPKEYTNGNYNAVLRLEFEDNKKVLPQAAELTLLVFPSLFERIFIGKSLLLILAAILLLICLLIFIIFIIRRSTVSSPVYGAINKHSSAASNGSAANTVTYNEESENHADRLNSFSAHNTKSEFYTAGAGTGGTVNFNKIGQQKNNDEMLRRQILSASLASQEPRGIKMAPANHLEKIQIKQNKSGMTEIYVLNQNRSIGKRNIHVMKPGTKMTVGGGKNDDFLIFLVPFPAHLAQVRYDGQDYHLAILKPEYFPYENSNIVNNCIGKTVTAVSDKGYHVYFTFRGYEDPSEKLNSILTSIKYE